MELSVYKSFLYVLLMNINICLGTFSMGYYLTVYNALIPQIDYNFGWTDKETEAIYMGIISALIPGGAFIANLVSDPIFNKIGRIKSTYLIDIVNIVGAFMTLFVSFPVLFIGRFLCGMSVGWNSILVGIYMNEINYKAHSHIFALLGGFSVNFGIVVSFLYGLNTLSMDELNKGINNQWWRFMFGFPIISCLLRMFCVRFLFNQESPYFLIEKKKFNEAKGVISKLFINDKVEEIYQNIHDSVVLKQKQKEEKLPNPLFEIFSKRYIIRFATGIIVGWANQLTGPVMMYSKPLFTAFTGSDTEANNLNGILGAVNLFSALIISVPLKYLGVKSTFMISILGCTINQGLIAIFTYKDVNLGSMISMYVFNFFFNLGCGPALFLIPPKILPDRLLGICFVVKWVFGFITTFCFPIMMTSSMGIDGSFLLMGLFFFVFMIFMLIFFPEIKGKNAKEISDIYAHVPLETEMSPVSPIGRS